MMIHIKYLGFFFLFVCGTVMNYHPIKCIDLLKSPAKYCVLNSRAVQEQFLKFSKHS